MVVTGLPLYQGKQLAVDATLVAPLTRTGKAHPEAWWEDGVALAQARHRKETTYPELLASDRCRLVVVGHETGGRWSEEAADFVDKLAKAKAREAPRVLQASAWFSWQRRWTTLVSMAAQDALATTLLTGSTEDLKYLEGLTPALHGVLSEDRCETQPEFSRLAL